MNRPYQHHHGRQSVTEYLSYVPKPIRDLALRSKVQDWDFVHVYSTDQAILRVINKEAMPQEELTFWTRVYRHYLGKCPLPDPDTHPARQIASIDPGEVVDASRTVTENIRQLFKALRRPLTRKDVQDMLISSGIIVNGYTVGHCFSYLKRKHQIAIKGPVKRSPRHQNSYIWIDG